MNLFVKKAGACIEEGEFRYDVLNQHQKSSGYHIAVCSEDATGVVKKVKYDASTNIFIRFATP